MADRDVILIANSQAGGLLDRNLTPETIGERIRAAGHKVTVLGGEPRELDGLIDQALARPEPLVVVAGGDGTINAVAQRLAGTDKTMSIIPSGTLNRLAQDLGIAPDLDSAIQVLGTGEAIDIDVGEVNGRVFLCNSMIGFTSRLAQQREHWRGRLTPITWARLLTRISVRLTRERPVRFALNDPPAPERRTRHLTVSVGDYEEAPGKFFTREDLATGLFGVYALKTPTVVRILKIGLGALVGRWRNEPQLEIATARALTVTGSRSRIRVMNDGEVLLLDLPLKFKMRPRSLRVLRAVADRTQPQSLAERLTA